MRELLDSVETAGELQGSEKSSSPDFRKAVPIESEAYQQMLAVLKESLRKQDVPSEEVHQYMRILHREHLIASAGPDRDPTPGLARGEPSKGASMSSGKVEIVSRGSVRRTSTIARRFGDHGPMSPRSSTVQVERTDTTVKDGPSTLVTRSIGDWDASRACIPHLRSCVSNSRGARIRASCSRPTVYGTLRRTRRRRTSFAVPSPRRLQRIV